MLKDYLAISFKSLRRRKLRSWLTMIGIFIGIAAVVALIGLGEGLRNAITSQFNLLGPDFITIQAGGVQFGPPGTGVVNPLTTDIVDKLEDINGVEIAFGRLIESGTLEFNDRSKVGLAASIPDGDRRKEIYRLLALEPDQGRLLKDGDGSKVMLGSNFGEEDLYGKPIRVGNRVLLNDKKFEVVGILEKKGTFVVDSVVMVNEDVLRDLTNEPDKISAIAVKVTQGFNLELVKEDIERLLRKERGVKEGEEDFDVTLAVNLLDTIDSTLFAVQIFVSIIAGISLLVGGIGIMNTMYTAVVERTKEIGIMKSIGAQNKDIFFLFLIESGLLGSVGGLVGVAVGAGMAKGLAFIGASQLGSDLIQAHISPFLVIGALLFSFIIGSVAGITPAIQASRLHPVEALRYAK